MIVNKVKRAIYSEKAYFADSVLNIYDLSKTKLQDHLCLQTLSLRGSNMKVQKQSKMKVCENFEAVSFF